MMMHYLLVLSTESDMITFFSPCVVSRVNPDDDALQGGPLTNRKVMHLSADLGSIL
jgi:hypothetical protein